MNIKGQEIEIPIKDIQVIWNVLKLLDIRPISVQLENVNPEIQVGLTLGEKEVINMGEPFPFMLSPSYAKFIDNINRVMSFYLRAIEQFEVNTKPVDLSIIYQRQSFIVFLINSLEVYLSMTFRQTTDILRIDDPNSDFIIDFIAKYGNIKKYNEYYGQENKPAFASKFIKRRLYFQQKDTTRDCFRFINISLPQLAPRLWQDIFSKSDDSYMQLRHKIIHGARPSFEEIENIYTIKKIESALFSIAHFVYLIESQRFQLYPRIEEKADFIQRLRF
jgi:hypothetical protein